MLTVVLVAAVVAAASDVPTCRLADAHVEELIAAKAAQLRGTEYCQFRIYDTIDDVDGDGTDDFIALFTVEGIDGGGNDHADFLLLLASSAKDSPILLQTGGRGVRDPMSIQVSNRRITLGTREYRPGDPMCCPSGHGTVVYEWHAGGLHEQRPATPRKPRQRAPTPHAR